MGIFKYFSWSMCNIQVLSKKNLVFKGFKTALHFQVLCKTVRTLGSVVQEEMTFKRFLIWTSGRPPAWWSGTIFAILKEGTMGNIHVKLYEVWISG